MKDLLPVLMAFLTVTACASPARGPAPAPAFASTPAPTNPDFSRIEAEVLVALNRARTEPARTADDLEALIKDYHGMLFQRPSQSIPVRTTEGAAAVREAVIAVRSERPVGALVFNPDLTRAARDLARDQERTGHIGHTGSDGSSVTTRVQRYGTWLHSIGENVAYAPVTNGADIVQNLLIDDGVPDRGHRRNIYDASSTIAGVACGPHPRYGTMCVIVQAGGFAPK